MSVFPRLIYRFNAIPTNPRKLFCTHGKPDCKVEIERQKTQSSQPNIEGEEKLTLPKFMAGHEATGIKTVWSWKKEGTDK